MRKQKVYLYIALLINFLGLLGIFTSKILNNEDLLLKFTIFFLVFCGFTVGTFIKYYKSFEIKPQGLLPTYITVFVSLFCNILIIFFAFELKLLFYIFNIFSLLLFSYFLLKYKRIQKGC